MAYNKDQGNKYYTENRERICAQERKKTRLRVQAGLCPKCGAVRQGKHLCDRCTERRNAQDRKRKQRWLVLGLCSHCGKPKEPERSHFKMCASCVKQTNSRKTAEYRKAWVEKRRAAGFCIRCYVRKATHGTQCEICRERTKKQSKKDREKLKDEIFNAYGGYHCACCGLDWQGIELYKLFFEIDHTNNKGNKHRKELGKVRIYRWLKQNDYPDGYQVLCILCNKAKAMNGGICPHKS